MREKVQRLLHTAILAFAGLVSVMAGGETVHARQASESMEITHLRIVVTGLFQDGTGGLDSLAYLEPVPAEWLIGSRSSRSIQFTLESNAGFDRAARIMFEEGATHGIDSLDSEKLWPLTISDSESTASILFFLNKSDSQKMLLAQDSRPFELARAFEVDMGHLHTGMSGEQKIRWSGLESLPGHWEVKLTDLSSGLEVNLREQEELVFQVSEAESIIRPETEGLQIHRPTPDQVTAPRFRLAVVPATGMNISNIGSAESTKVELYPNYPNPFRGVTTIEFHLPEPMPVVVSVYNIVGQRVGQLMNGEGTTGQNDLVWDASEMPSGIYIVRLETPSATHTRKMTLIK